MNRDSCRAEQGERTAAQRRHPLLNKLTFFCSLLHFPLAASLLSSPLLSSAASHLSSLKSAALSFVLPSYGYTRHLHHQHHAILCCLLLLFCIGLLALSAPFVIAQPESGAESVLVSVADTSSAAPLPEFVPTDEWQTVLPGQSVPPGLWVRVDMTTGERTARLLPEEERNGAGSALVAVPEGEQQAEKAAAAASTDGPFIRELAAPGTEQ